MHCFDTDQLAKRDVNVTDFDVTQIASETKAFETEIICQDEPHQQ